MDAQSTVTIKLTGGQYRTLCRELEYHAVTLAEELKAVPQPGPHRTSVMQRRAQFEDVRERVAA